MSEIIHVAAAVIYDRKRQSILIAKRPDDKHQGGKWEFPGGKVESGETVRQALERELREELDIRNAAAAPLIQIRYQYPDKSVFLDVFEVTAFDGMPKGKEGQQITWAAREKLGIYKFPTANIPILLAVQLPDRCLITPEPDDESEFLEHLQQLLEKDLTLIQFRAKQLPADNYLKLAEKTIDLAHRYEAKVLLNSPPQLLANADGLHLTSSQLLGLDTRPQLQPQQILSASCHDKIELQKAAEFNAGLAFLSPVKATRSHPGVTALGWKSFYELSRYANLPIFALGGLAVSDINEAKKHGAQGIAAISGLWNR